MENNHQSPQTKNLSTPPPTIPLQEAINRASNWRNLLKSIPADPNQPIQEGAFVGAIPDNMLFRAINIRMEDIIGLAEMHKDAVAVRLYLSVIDSENPYHISGMLVPVDAQNRDILTTSVDPGLTLKEIMADDSSSTVYDFTQPCPTVCNTGSPLFDETNAAESYFRYKK